MANDQGYGYVQPNDHLGNYNPTAAIIEQMLARVRTAGPCKVAAVNSALATVDIIPLVSIVDGMGNATPHGTVYGIPYINITLPKVGDVGAFICCDRDISSVKATQAAAPPPSMRTFAFSDAIYIGALFGVPGQSIAFTATGVTISDQNGNQIIMGPGFVNVVTPVFQVNGVPVTVP